MIYNDYPILNNDEYKILSEHYSSHLTFDRKTSVYNICNYLNSCICFCNGINNEFNNKICNTIKESKNTLTKVLENIKSTFNIEYTTTTVINLNLFSFLNKLTNISILFNVWASNEQKDYYRTFANKSLLELLNCIKNLISVLENSNLHFFKHM